MKMGKKIVFFSATLWPKYNLYRVQWGFQTGFEGVALTPHAIWGFSYLTHTIEWVAKTFPLLKDPIHRCSCLAGVVGLFCLPQLLSKERKHAFILVLRSTWGPPFGSWK